MFCSSAIYLTAWNSSHPLAGAGLAGLDSQDSRGIKSLEIGSPDASSYRRKSFMQSLFSLPANQAKVQSW